MVLQLHIRLPLFFQIDNFKRLQDHIIAKDDTNGGTLKKEQSK
jgi:hypothetical protein